MSHKDKLIVIGASYLQVPLIEKAKEMGFETHIFAWEEGAVGKSLADKFYAISILEKEEILSIAKKIKPLGIVSIGSDLAMHTVNYVAKNLGLIGNSLQCTEISTNKFRMRDAFKTNGLPSPNFTFCLENEKPDIRGFNFPIIVKPTDRSGSRGVTKVDSYQMVDFALQRAWDESLNKEAIIEEFVSGREISVEMISWKGEHHYLSCTDKVTTGPPYFVELEHHQPAQLSKSLENQVVEITRKALSALKVEYGASHTEIIITPDHKLFLVEIGARMGGDHIGAKLVLGSTGYDFVKGVIDVAVGNFENVNKPLSCYSGIYYLVSNYGVIKNIKWNEPLPEHFIDSQFIVKNGDTINILKSSANRIGYAIYRSENIKINLNPQELFTIEYEKNNSIN